MYKDFEKLNRRLRNAAICKAIVFGVALGLFGASAVAVVQKLMAAEPDAVLCACVGGGALLLGGCLFLLATLPTERRNARYLDDHLGLHERVQTMVAFQDEESDMLTVQREDTVRILNETPKKKFRTGRAWVHLILPVLACACLAAAVLLPVQAKELPPEQDPIDENDQWELTDWHRTAVQALIEEVQKSKLVEDGKTQIIQTLQSMLTALEPIKTKTQMKQIVTSAMVDIDATVDDINTFTALVDALAASPNSKVKELAPALGHPSTPISEREYHALKAGFSTDGWQDDLTVFASALQTAADAAKTDKTDALCQALMTFAQDLTAFADQQATAGETERDNGLTAAFEKAAAKIGAAMSQQGENRAVSENTNNQLMSIFGVSWNDLPEALRYPNDKEAGTENNEYEEKEDEILNSGGLGGGDVIYGSDDAVYYPTDDAHVKYGDVIDEYDGKKTSEMDERPLTDELKEFIDDYFADLYYNNENQD